MNKDNPSRAIKLESGKVENGSYGKSWLFGVGINNYKHFPALNNAVGDVKAIKELLRQKYRIDEIITLFDQDATRRNIFQQLKALEQEIGPDDKLLILFSGHGFLSNKGGHWVPYEAEPGFDDDYLPNFHLKVYLRNIKAKHILVISDSCFSGSLFAEGIVRKVPGPEEQFEQLKSRYGFCSGRFTEEVWDGPKGGHSPFAGSIIDILKENREAVLRASVFADRVLNRTTAKYRQLPRHGPLFDVGDKGGQYIFRLKNAPLALSPSSSIKTGAFPNTFTDPRDGQTYRTIKLNGQVWMAENLNYDAGEGCEIYDQLPVNSQVYGRLYTWEAAQRACPPGWRLPTDEEWRALAISIGGYGSDSWRASDSHGSATEGFAALVDGGSTQFNGRFAGYFQSPGKYYGLGTYGGFWTATAYDERTAWTFKLLRNDNRLERQKVKKLRGISCRCVQELST